MSNSQALWRRKGIFKGKRRMEKWGMHFWKRSDSSWFMSCTIVFNEIYASDADRVQKSTVVISLILLLRHI